MKQTRNRSCFVLFRFKPKFIFVCFEDTLPGAAGRFSAISWRTSGGRRPTEAARWGGADVCSTPGDLASSLGGGGAVVWLEKGAAVGRARGGRGVRHDADTGRRDHQREGEDRKEMCLHSSVSVLRGERYGNLFF